MGVAGDLGVRAVRRCESLGGGAFSETRAGLFRPYLSGAHRAALDRTAAWMSEAGMTTRIDGAANLIGRYEGVEPGLPAMMIGSHIDSVRNGGVYDGPLGVMLGIDCVEALSRAGQRLAFAIEVAAFGDEEGSRFPASMGCSRALVGALDEGFAALTDAAGVSVADALSAFGLDPGGLSGARRTSGDILGFVEPHIEQGPTLEAAGCAVGLVTAIAAQRRVRVRWTGRAGHAGTTPMALRRDPLAAAAAAMSAVEALCRTGSDGLVGTVGQISVEPGAFNVIPGAASFSLDIRAGTDVACDAALSALTAQFSAIGAARNIGLEIERIQSLPASPADPLLSEGLARAVTRVTGACRRLPSGAAHDTMIMAALCRTSMMFIRCRGGLSHHPDEHVDPADGATALAVLLAFLGAYEAPTKTMAAT